MTRSLDISGRRLIAIALGAALVGTALLASLLYADRSPAPHHLPVDVVGPPAAVQAVGAGLAKAAPGGFDVRAVATEAAARTDLHGQDAVGALVLGQGSARVLTAGAAGASMQQVVSSALAAAASHTGDRVTTEDVVPLPGRDRGGVSAFVVGLALLVPSVVGSLGLFLAGRRARLWWRVGAGAVFSVVIGAAVVLVADVGLGALTGAWPALFGISVFGALTFALVVAAVQATFGAAGTGLAALVLIFLGNAVSGGSVATQLLPDGYRQLSPWLPNGAVVHALRAAVYFDGNGIGQPLLALALWTAGALIVLLVNDVVHLRLRRRTPERAAQIHATSGVGHLAGWVRRERYHGTHELPAGQHAAGLV